MYVIEVKDSAQGHTTPSPEEWGRSQPSHLGQASELHRAHCMLRGLNVMRKLLILTFQVKHSKGLDEY